MEHTKLLLLVLLGILIFTLAGCTSDYSSYETNEYTIAELFQNIWINMEEADVCFLLSEDAVCRVVSYSHKNQTAVVFASNGTLQITEQDDRAWHEGLFSFGTPLLTVYLPASEYASLTIKGDTGDTTVPGEFKFDSVDIAVNTGDVNYYASATGAVKIKCSTGDVRVGQITAGAVDITASTGKVFVNGLTCAGDVSVKVTTGDMALKNFSFQNLVTEGDTGDLLMENVTANGNMTLERSTGEVEVLNAACAGDIAATVSTGKVGFSNVTCTNLRSTGDTGKIALKDVIATAQFLITRTTGDVFLGDSDAAEIYVTTSTGDVTGHLLSDKVFIVRTSTGKIDTPKTITGGRCEITTSTGDIKFSAP